MESSIIKILRKQNIFQGFILKKEFYLRITKVSALIKIIIISFPFVFLYQYCLSQSCIECEVSGVVKDSLNQTVSYAIVQLINITDSSKRIGFSNDSGNFSFKSLSYGKYKLVVKHLSFGQYKSSPFMINKTEHKVFQSIVLLHKNVELKPIYIHGGNVLSLKQDRLVYKVKHDITTKGENAIGILKTFPGITSNRDNLNILGSTNYGLMINGKIKHISKSLINQYLKNINSESIRNIEIITSPSARYTKSKIININLIQPARNGITGNISTKYSQGEYAQNNSSINLDAKINKLMLHGFINYYNGIDLNKSKGSKTIKKIAYFDLNTKDKKKYNVLFSGLSANYTIDNKNQLSIDLSIYKANVHDITNGNYKISSTAGNKFDSATSFLNKDIIPITKEAASFSYDHIFDTASDKTNKLSVGVGLVNNVLKINEKNSSTISNYLTDKDKRESFTLNSNSDNKIYAGQVDYQKGSKKIGKIGIGYKISTSINNNKYFGEYNPINSPQKFKYKETINAFYLNYSKSWNKFNSNIGIRYENSYIHFKQSDNDRVNYSLNYFIPSLSFKYSFSSSLGLQAIFKSILDRPGFSDLSPFTYYKDTYNSTIGNPTIKPRFTNVAQLIAVLKHKYIFRFEFVNLQNLTTSIPDSLNGLQVIYKSLPISNQNMYTISAGVPFKFKGLNATLNLSSTYNRYQYGTDDNEYRLHSDQTISYRGFIHASYKLNDRSSLFLSGLYTSRGIYNIITVDPKGELRVGYKIALLKDKSLTISIEGEDIFNTNNERKHVNYNFLKYNIHSYYDYRRITLKVSYNFQNGIKFRFPHHTSATRSEESRLREK